MPLSPSRPPIQLSFAFIRRCADCRDWYALGAQVVGREDFCNHCCRADLAIRFELRREQKPA